MEHSSIVHLWSFGCMIALMGSALGICQAADEVTRGVGSWPAEMGNHRARVKVSARADAVLAHIPWRRHDSAPRDMDILVVDAATGKQIANVARVRVDRESGDIAFQPATAPGEYYVYYMPYAVGRA